MYCCYEIKLRKSLCDWQAYFDILYMDKDCPRGTLVNSTDKLINIYWQMVQFNIYLVKYRLTEGVCDVSTN